MTGSLNPQVRINAPSLQNTDGIVPVLDVSFPDNGAFWLLEGFLSKKHHVKAPAVVGRIVFPYLNPCREFPFILDSV